MDGIIVDSLQGGSEKVQLSVIFFACLIVLLHDKNNASEQMSDFVIELAHWQHNNNVSDSALGECFHILKSKYTPLSEPQEVIDQFPPSVHVFNRIRCLAGSITHCCIHKLVIMPR